MNFELNLKVFLIACPMVFLAGFVDSIGGGGGLISLPAYLFAGLPIHNATATNKLSSTMGTTVSTYRICKGQTIRWKLIVPAICLSLLGSFIGTKLNLITDDAVLKKILLLVLPVAAISMFSNKKTEKSSYITKVSPRLECVIVYSSALIMGVYDGFYGPGTGTFLMMIFIGIAKMKVIDAACYTKLLNLSSNISSVTTYLTSGKCIIVLGLAAGLCNMAGAYLGSGLVLKNGKKIVRPIIILVLILLFLKVLSELN